MAERSVIISKVKEKFEKILEVINSTLDAIKVSGFKTYIQNRKRSRIYNYNIFENIPALLDLDKAKINGSDNYDFLKRLIQELVTQNYKFCRAHPLLSYPEFKSHVQEQNMALSDRELKSSYRQFLKERHLTYRKQLERKGLIIMGHLYENLTRLISHQNISLNDVNVNITDPTSDLHVKSFYAVAQADGRSMSTNEIANEIRYTLLAAYENYDDTEIYSPDDSVDDLLGKVVEQYVYRVTRDIVTAVKAHDSKFTNTANNTAYQLIELANNDQAKFAIESSYNATKSQKLNYFAEETITQQDIINSIIRILNSGHYFQETIEELELADQQKDEVSALFSDFFTKPESLELSDSLYKTLLEKVGNEYAERFSLTITDVYNQFIKREIELSSALEIIEKELTSSEDSESSSNRRDVKSLQEKQAAILNEQNPLGLKLKFEAETYSKIKNIPFETAINQERKNIMGIISKATHEAYLDFFHSVLVEALDFIFSSYGKKIHRTSEATDEHDIDEADEAA